MANDRPIESYIWQIIKAGLSFTAVILYSQVLGAAGRGILSIYLLYVQVFLMMNELFVGSALANWISKFGLRRFIPRIALVSGIMLCLVGLLGAYFNAIGGEKSSTEPNTRFSLMLGLLMVWSLVLIVQNVAMNFFQSRGDIIEKNKWLVGFEGLKVGGLLILIFTISQSVVHIEQIMMALVLGGILWVIFCVFRLFSLRAFSMQKKSENESIGHTWNEGIWAQIGQITLFFIYRIPLFVAARWMGDAAAGILANALLVIDTIWIYANTMGTIVHGRALQFANQEKQEKITLRFTAFSFWGTLLLLGAVVIVPNSLFTWVFGAEFFPMKSLVIQAIPGIMALAVFAPFGNLFHARNQFKLLLWNHAMGLGVMSLILSGFFLGIESFQFTQLIWAWNIALVTVMFAHIYRGKFTKKRNLNFALNTLLIYRLIRKWGRL